jgi:hypothetical protein
LDASKHLAGNAGFKLRQRLGKVPLSRYFDCGTTQVGPNAESYDVYLTVLTSVASDAGGAKVATVVDASAKPVAFSQAYSACSTTTALEKRLQTLVILLAGQSSPAKKPL